MSENSEKSEKKDITSSIKEIPNFKETQLKALLDSVKDIKSNITKAVDKLAARKAEITELKKRQAAAEQPVVIEEVVEIATPNTEESIETTVETPTIAVADKIIEDKPKAQTESRVEQPRPQTKTYIPEASRREDRPQRSGFNNNGERRPQTAGDNRFNNTAGGNNNYNRNGGGFNGARQQTPVAPPPIAKDAKPKQKAKPQSSYDDKRKQPPNKRTLVRKGYVNDITTDENGYVKHIKNRKLKKGEQFNPVPIVIEHATVATMDVAIKTLAEKIGKSAIEIVKKLFLLGQEFTINDTIDFDTAELVASDFGITLEYKPDKTAEDMMNASIVVEGNLVKRPPVVTIMGHVDHGKTSLLDYIRNTKVVQGEAGGITQHIGAYTITVQGEAITFLDTPGHEAFTSMRKRGAKVTDIAIIVVAADDGIMPQTIEAINHAKEAGVSIMVAVNKIDKPTANVDKILQQLTQYDVMPEQWGGDVIVTPVSAKTGEGVDKLLENILLVAEVKELKAIEDCPAQGSVIEARLDKGTGPVATILIQNGTLRVSDYIVAGTSTGKVRALINDKGQRVNSAGPSYAVSVLGFSEVPNAGDQLIVVQDEKLSRQVAQERLTKERGEMASKSSRRNLEDMFKGMSDGEMKSLGVIIKGDVQGSVEAVKQALVKLSDDMSEQGVNIKILHTGVGAINESDVMLADTANSIIVGFNVRPEPKAKQLRDKTNVDIKIYRVIYDAIDDITLALRGMLDPVYREVELGHAEVRETFRITNVGTIAGCYVTDGKVARNAKFRLIRDNVVVYDGNISSLKRNKDEAKEVAAGYECGIGLENFNDMKIGDIIEAFILKEEEYGVKS